jgi:hypothetical protein
MGGKMAPPFSLICTPNLPCKFLPAPPNLSLQYANVSLLYPKRLPAPLERDSGSKALKDIAKFTQ